jgi:hypothetical protein
MSIYRRETPIAANIRRSARRGSDEGVRQDSANGAQNEWMGLRKAQPSNTVLPLTRRWMKSIPPEYRPQTLPIRFGRIANLLAAHWDDPKHCTAYITSLLRDTRGNRKGFPPEVQQDILDLRVYYAALHPIVHWDLDSDPKR